MSNTWKGPLERVDRFRWRIPETYKPGMRVPGLIYVDEDDLDVIREDQAPEQVANEKVLSMYPSLYWRDTSTQESLISLEI
jgi:hypothetical protein